MIATLTAPASAAACVAGEPADAVAGTSESAYAATSATLSPWAEEIGCGSPRPSS